MLINRKTYEEFFLLYNDGELNFEEKKAVEEFIRENPDLEQELILLQNSVLAADESIVYDDKEQLYRHDKDNIFSFPWFRAAVAAVLLIAFGISGWLYLSDKNNMQQPTVASNEGKRDDSEQPKNVKPVRVPQELPTNTNEDKEQKSVSENSNRQITSPVEDEHTPGKNAKRLTKQIVKPVISPEPADVNQEAIPYEMENIDVTVTPRDISVVEQESPIDEMVIPVTNDREQQTTVVYVQEENNDMIYFANTSLPKKSKLRGVFRKATRILDKVTSLQ